jgi:hypothetical protein
VTPAEALARQWAAFSAAGMLVEATRQPTPGATASAQVMLDTPDASADFGDVVVAERRVTYRMSDWPAVREGESVAIGNRTYRVRRQAAIDDGLLAVLDLV